MTARPVRAALAAATTIVTLAVPCTPALAVPAISGKVKGAKGYTVMLLGRDGQAQSSKLNAKGQFSFPAARTRGATLQLIAPSGRYYGPVVLGSSRRRVFVQLSGKPGTLKVTLRGTYGQARATSKIVDRSRSVPASRGGAPLGAGKLGAVRVPAGKGAARIAQQGQGAAPLSSGADPDGDGIPAAFDAANTPAGTLDATTPGAPAKGDGVFSTFYLDQRSTVNANVTGVSDDELLRRLAASNSLNFFVDAAAAGGTASAVNLDCGTLSYCSPVSRTAKPDTSSNNSPLSPGTTWTQLDSDGDGLPNIPANPRFGANLFTLAFFPAPASLADIRPGDLYQLRYTTPSGPVTVPSSLTFFFTSVPAVSATTADGVTRPVTYDGSAAALQAGQDGKITLTWWRPQRAALPGELGPQDIGHLHYGLALNGGSREASCSSQYLSDPSSTLQVASGQDQYASLFPLSDSSDDADVDATRTLSVTVDLRRCLADQGLTSSGDVQVTLMAADESRRGGVDRAAQMLTVSLP